MVFLIIEEIILAVEERFERNEIFGKRVKAGKRTYFFDLKSTRADDYYLTITESKKKFAQDGSFVFEKHKIFLYKEDFEKFVEALSEAYDKVKELMPDYDFSRPPQQGEEDDRQNSWD
jgi:hypothetical protein